MEYLRSTGASGGLIFTRTSSASIKERCSELLRIVSEADRAIIDCRPDAPMRLSLIRDLVVATVGPSWVRDHDGDPALALLRAANLTALATTGSATRFDRICSDILRARFPEETVGLERNARRG